MEKLIQNRKLAIIKNSDDTNAVRSSEINGEVINAKVNVSASSYFFRYNGDSVATRKAPYMAGEDTYDLQSTDPWGTERQARLKALLRETALLNWDESRLRKCPKEEKVCHEKRRECKKYRPMCFRRAS